MNILWIPHTHWDSRTFRRDTHLINYLKLNNRIFVLTWEGYEGKGLKSKLHFIFKTLKFYTYKEDNVKIYHIPKLFGIGTPWRFPFIISTKINEYIFNNYLINILIKEKVDVIIIGPNASLVGYPKGNLVPIVFDFLDCSDWSYKNEWSEMEKKYFFISNVVICISEYAYRIAKRYNKNVIIIPNGVEIEKFYGKNKKEAKKILGFENKKVISLIGPTFSKDDYFMKAIIDVLNSKDDVIFLLVGYNDMVEKIRKKYNNERIHYIDFIPYLEIFNYFLATDIGIYPGDDSAWFNGALPLKVLEYTASGCWVLVSPELISIKSLNFENIVFAKNEVIDFKKKLLELLEKKNPKIDYKKLNNYSWERIGKNLEEFLLDFLRKKT